MDLVARRVRVAALVLACAQTAVALAQVEALAPMPLSERAYRASRVYAAALTYLAHWPDAPDEAAIEAAYRAYLEAALASEERAAFARASMRFLATFRNGHTLFLDLQVARQGGTLPFAAQTVGGRWVVTASRLDALRPGDTVETIDGRPFEEFFRELQPLIATSTERWARRALFMRFGAATVYAHLFRERFVLGLGDGRRVEVDRSAMPGIETRTTEGRWLDPGRLGYVRVHSFSEPAFEKRAIELVREYEKAAALVVDVRGNSGGSTPQELTKRLMNRPHRWWTESTPASLPYFRLRAAEGSWQYQPFGRPELLWRSPTSEPEKDAYPGRLAILVDAGCFSACEDFVLPFKDNGRAVLVGETTGGSSGQPYMLDLGDGMQAIVGAKREMFPDGSPFEGMGIRPDVEVSPTAEDLRRGRDAALESATQRLLTAGDDKPATGSER
jgi:carboxyl-terminal processing protease